MAFYDWSKNVPTSLPTLGGTQPKRTTWSTPTQGGVQASLPSNKLSWSVADEEEDEDELRKKIAALPWNKPTEKAQAERPKSPYVSQTKEEIERKYGFTPTTQTGSGADFVGGKASAGITGAFSSLTNAKTNVMRFATTAFDKIFKTDVSSVFDAPTQEDTFWKRAGRFALTTNPLDPTQGGLIGAAIRAVVKKDSTAALDVGMAGRELARASKEADERAEQLRPEVGKVTAFIGDLARSAPTTAMMAIPGAGTLVMGASVFSSNVEEKLPMENADWKDMLHVVGSSAVTIAVEKISGLFGEAALFKTGGAKAIKAAIAKGVTATGKIGQVLWVVNKAAVGEAAEEMIEYPFQQLMEWKLQNPESKWEDNFSWKEMGRSGLLGYVSGAIFSSGGAVIQKARSGRADPINVAVYDGLVEKVAGIDVNEMDTPENQSTIKQMLQVATDAITDNGDLDAIGSIAKIVEQEAESVTSDTASVVRGAQGGTSVSGAEQASVTTPTVETAPRGSTQVETASAQQAQSEPVQQAQRTEQRKPVQEKAKAIYQAVESAETDADINSIVTQALDADSDIVDSLTEKIDTVDKLAGYMTEARASLIRGSSMTFGGRGMGLFLSLRDSQEFSPEKVAKTNIIILQRFAERVLKVPKGSRVSNYLNNMIKYLNKTLPPEQMELFESTITDDDMWYEVLHNADVVNDAKSILEDKNKGRRKKSLDSLFNKLTLKQNEDGELKEFVMKPHEMVALSKWAMELISTGDDASMLKANAIIGHVRERMTASGQFSNAAKVVYDLLYPERVAERLVNEAESSNDPIKQKRFNDATEKSATTIRNERKKAATDAVEDVTKKTPAEILRDRILADLKPKTKQEVSDVQKMINTLFRIYKETNRATRTATDPYEAIADMVMNRAQYATVWNKAKELIIQDGSYDQRLVDYIQRLADPTITKRSMDLVIAETIRQMKDAPAMVAKRYFLTGGESITEFMQLLRTNMPELDDASFKYLSDAISNRFKERMEIRRASMRAAIEKQFDDAGGRIRPKAKSAIDKAVSQMMDAAAKNAFDFDPIRKAWAERLGLTALSQKAVDDIYSTMRKIAMATDDETKETLYYDMIKRIGQEAEGSWYEKYLGWRRLAMLGNPVTWINNGGNNYLGAGVYRLSDRLTAAFDRISGEKIDPEYRTFGDRVIKEGENAEIDSAVDRQTERKRMARIIDTNMKYTVGRFFNREKRIFKNKKIEYASKAVQQIMSTGTATHDGKGLVVKIGGKEVNLAAWLGDAAPLRGHVRHALRNKLYAQGYHNISDATAKAKMLEEATDYAIQVGLTRTFRQKTLLSEKILSLKSSQATKARIKELVDRGELTKARQLRNASIALDAAIDTTVPFVTTLFALTNEAYKFSPVALGVELIRLGVYSSTPTLNKISKSVFGATFLTQQDGQALHNIHAGLAQALTGTASSFLVGLVGGFLGVLTASAPDNDKEKKLWAQEGKLPFSVYIPGIGSFSLANMAPVALPLIMGAEFAKQMQEKNYSFSGMTSAGIASFDAFIDNTIVGELLSVFGGGYGKSTMSNTVQAQGQDGLFQFFPSVTRRFNRIFDLYERDIYTGNAVNILKNKVLSYVPFGTFLVPPRVDIWGNKVKQTPGVSDAGGIALNTVKNMLLPFITKGVNRDAVTTEVSRVFNVTGETSALPIVAQKTFKTKIGKTEYSEQPVGKEWETYQTIIGQLQHEYADIVIDSDRYRSATDDERVKLLKKAYAKASEDAKEQYVREKYKIN